MSSHEYKSRCWLQCFATKASHAAGHRPTEIVEGPMLDWPEIGARDYDGGVFAEPCAQLRVNATCNIEHSDLRRHTTIGKIIPLVGSLWHSGFGCAIFRGTIPHCTMLSNGDLPRALQWC